MIKCSSSFNDEFAKTLLVDCDIEMIGYVGGIVLHKEDISYYKISLFNKYVCEVLPREETTFEIKNWNNLSQAEQGLIAVGFPINVYYIVNGIKTTGARNCVISDVKVNYKGDTAVVKAVSLLARKTANQPTNYTSWLMSNWLRNMIASYNSWAQRYEVWLGYPYTATTISNDFTSVANVFSNITKAEAIQNIIASCGGGFRLSYDDDDYFTSSIISLTAKINSDFYHAYVFPQKNIYDDIDINSVETYNQIGVFGYTKGTTTHTLVSFNFSATSSSFTQSGQLESMDYYVARVYIENSQYHYNADSYDVIGTYVVANFSGVVYNLPYKFVAEGVDLYPPSIGGDYQISITAPNCENTNTTQLNKVKNDALLYYSITQEISFSCRINPCIEPLDIISALGHTIVVEYVEISFNGGYEGKIRGKIIDNKAPTIQAPQNVGGSYYTQDNVDGISVYFNNNNAMAIDGLVFYDDYGTRYVASSQIIHNPFQPYDQTAQICYTLPTQTTPTQSWGALKHDGDLTTNIYIAFRVGNHESSRVVAIHRDVIAEPPEIDDCEYSDYENFYWYIINNNDYPVTLLVGYSGGTLTYSVGANEIFLLNNSNAPALEPTIHNYTRGIQYDSIIARFQDEHGAYSDMIYLLR